MLVLVDRRFSVDLLFPRDWVIQLAVGELVLASLDFVVDASVGFSCEGLSVDFPPFESSPDEAASSDFLSFPASAERAVSVRFSLFLKSVSYQPVPFK